MSNTQVVHPVDGVRLEFDTEGYIRYRVWEPAEERDFYLYEHRLHAYAHGVMESVFDPVDVHHVDGDTWRNTSENIEEKPRDAHAAEQPHVGNLKENHNGKRTAE